jgi:hypothetical protein
VQEPLQRYRQTSNVEPRPHGEESEQSPQALGGGGPGARTAARCLVGGAVRAAGRERASAGESDDDKSGVGAIRADAAKEAFPAAEQDTAAGRQAHAAFLELIRQQ